jgi:hypothetical protein
MSFLGQEISLMLFGLAALRGQSLTVKFLLEHGASIDALSMYVPV